MPKNQVSDLVIEILKRKAKNERVLVTTVRRPPRLWRGIFGGRKENKSQWENFNLPKVAYLPF